VGAGGRWRKAHPKVAGLEEAVNVIDNVGVTRLPHNEDLIDDQLLLGLLIKVHLLDGNLEKKAKRRRT
jgi:hypothetical protein